MSHSQHTEAIDEDIAQKKRQQPDTPFETVVTDTTEQKLAKTVAAIYLKSADETDSQPFSILW